MRHPLHSVYEIYYVETVFLPIGSDNLVILLRCLLVPALGLVAVLILIIVGVRLFCGRILPLALGIAIVAVIWLGVGIGVIRVIGGITLAI